MRFGYRRSGFVNPLSSKATCSRTSATALQKNRQHLSIHSPERITLSHGSICAWQRCRRLPFNGKISHHWRNHFRRIWALLRNSQLIHVTGPRQTSKKIIKRRWGYVWDVLLWPDWVKAVLIGHTNGVPWAWFSFRDFMLRRARA